VGMQGVCWRGSGVGAFLSGSCGVAELSWWCEGCPNASKRDVCIVLYCPWLAALPSKGIVSV
jgi:hypothetical protein